MKKNVHSTSLNIYLKNVPVCLRVRYGSEALETIYPSRIKEKMMNVRDTEGGEMIR